jgi:hypothetical protein
MEHNRPSPLCVHYGTEDGNTRDIRQTCAVSGFLLKRDQVLVFVIHGRNSEEICMSMRALVMRLHETMGIAGVT